MQFFIVCDIFQKIYLIEYPPKFPPVRNKNFEQQQKKTPNKVCSY